MDYIEEYRKVFNGGKFIRKGKEITMSEYRAFDGGGVRTLIDKLLLELENRTSVTVLDYGCGEALQWHQQTYLGKTKSLPNILGNKLQGYYRYDPACEPFTKKPSTKFDIILCADVLEHIPDDKIESFFAELNSFTIKTSMIFYSISTVPSNNKFISGENMHVNVKSPDDWVAILKKYSICKVCLVFNGNYKY